MLTLIAKAFQLLASSWFKDIVPFVTTNNWSISGIQEVGLLSGNVQSHLIYSSESISNCPLDGGWWVRWRGSRILTNWSKFNGFKSMTIGSWVLIQSCSHCSTVDTKGFQRSWSWHTRCWNGTSLDCYQSPYSTIPSHLVLATQNVHCKSPNEQNSYDDNCNSEFRHANVLKCKKLKSEL